MREKELCTVSRLTISDHRYGGAESTPELLFFSIGTETVRELVCQPLDETEGDQPRIRLTGIIYSVEWASRTQAWNVSERKCIIDQSLLGDVVLFFAKRRAETGGLEENNSLYKMLHVCCAIVSYPALLPTSSPLHPHR